MKEVRRKETRWEIEEVDKEVYVIGAGREDEEEAE